MLLGSDAALAEIASHVGSARSLRSNSSAGTWCDIAARFATATFRMTSRPTPWGAVMLISQLFSVQCLSVSRRYRIAAAALLSSACGAAATDGVSDESEAAEPALPPVVPPQIHPMPAAPQEVAPPPAAPEVDLPGANGLPARCIGARGKASEQTVEVRNQVELDALAGCTTIIGDLTIEPFEGVDLRPLAALEVVQGTLTLGSLFDDPPPLGFPSLEGLENLEAVAVLSLRGIQAPSLRPLSGLRRFVSSSVAQRGAVAPGMLFVDYASELTDLSGLERLEGLRTVIVKNSSKLTSLRGIVIPERLSQLDVWDTPLEDLGDVSRLTEVTDTLWFIRTALVTAAGLEGVSRVGQLQFWGNPLLRDLSSLSGLTAATYFNLIENPALEALPALDGLTSLGGLVISDNAALRELPRIPIASLREAWIERNSNLERISAFMETQNVYQLRVADNPRLSFLDLRQLRSVTDLWIVNNPALDDSTMQGLSLLEHSQVRIAGNLGQALPLAQCPWTGEGICDELAYHPYGLCAEGTDQDCDPFRR